MIHKTCLCGHGILLHSLTGLVVGSCAYRLDGIGEPGCGCLYYKLDNLKLIEDTAEDRGLV